MRIRRRPGFLRLFAVFAVLAGSVCLSGESEQAQPYTTIRYPTFANGRLQSMLEADQAEAYDLTEGTPRINLQNVRVTLYDHSEKSLRETPLDQPLPVKMTITSDRGFFTRRPPEAGAAPEEVANLEGNVVLRQMRVSATPPPPSLQKRRLDPAVETEVKCEHAQWNNTLRKLNGDGKVTVTQEDSTIDGTGFLYLADDEAMDKGTGASNIKDWGGIIFIEHNARMVINRAGLDQGAIGETVITCRDTASYKLREREIQFEREVKVNRRGLMIESDILKVFLRHEDDPLPAETIGGDPNAGQVKSIIATIGKRPGSVVVTGYDPDSIGDVILYTARGGRADFDYDTNRITLTDSRLERVPEVVFGQDRISDRTLDFILTNVTQDAPGGGKRQATTLNELNASGGQGQVLLRSRQFEDGPAVPTEINYKGDMNYSRQDGRIRFRDSVFLKRGDLRIRAEAIEVRLIAGENDLIADQLSRVLAETDVSINTGNREARAQRAEYDLVTGTTPDGTEQTLDVLRLFGPAQGTPPYPWVRDEDGNQITAPIIHMQRLKTGPGEKPRHLVHGTGGVAVCDFYASSEAISEQGKIISIKCENGMEYNEAKGLAWFAGAVMATSDAPEDSYVMTSDRLDIYMVEDPDPTKGGETVMRLRRIDASGNARLMQDARVCEAHQIIRDFPTSNMNEGDIYLEGTPPSGGQAGRNAVYREQIGTGVGSMFTAPRIMASATGNLIRANGPGELSMPDDPTGLSMPNDANRAKIIFAGAARYESFHNGLASEAKFRKGVVLRQPSRHLEITAEELDTRFLNDGPGASQSANPRVVEIERIGRLRRAEGRINVRLEHAQPRQGRRLATADQGVIEFTDTGNVITLTADRRLDNRRFVMTRDHDGLTLRSPQIEVRELQGITRAAGPGELQIPGDQANEGLSRVPTRVLYGENGMMVYNELAMNIRVSDNVRIVQPGLGDNWSFPSLDGRCDRMEITLLEPPTGGMAGEEALSRVLRMDAMGGVLLRVYADPPPDNPNIDWLSRPGTTFFTRGDQAVYDVPDGRIVISSLPPRQPQLLLNMVDVGSQPRRQRLKADRFVLNTNTIPRRWYFEGQLESNTLRSGEAFEFQD